MITGVITVTAHCCATGREREHCFFLGNRRVYGDRSFAVFSCREACANPRHEPRTLFSIGHSLVSFSDPGFLRLRPTRSHVAEKYERDSRWNAPLARVLFIIFVRLIDRPSAPILLGISLVIPRTLPSRDFYRLIDWTLARPFLVLRFSYIFA